MALAQLCKNAWAPYRVDPGGLITSTLGKEIRPSGDSIRNKSDRSSPALRLGIFSFSRKNPLAQRGEIFAGAFLIYRTFLSLLPDNSK